MMDSQDASGYQGTILLDLEYQEWSENLLTSWRPRIIRKSGITSIEDANEGILSHWFPEHVYEDIYVALAWGNYRATRIHMHEVCLRCVSLIESRTNAGISFDIERTRKQSRAIILDLVSDMCSSASFCLGDIGSDGNQEKSRPLSGYLTTNQIYTVFVSSPAESQCELWLKSKLDYITNVMGVQAA